MAANTGKGVKTRLNRKVMNKNEIPDSLKDYAEKWTEKTRLI